MRCLLKKAVPEALAIKVAAAGTVSPKLSGSRAFEPGHPALALNVGRLGS